MDEKIEKTCANCDYFIQHYMQYFGEYIPLERGTCMCNKANKEKFKKDSACVFWTEKKN